MRYQFNDGGRAAAGYKGKAGDCAARALAIAAGLRYQDAYERINAAATRERPRGTRKRSDARSGVWPETLGRVLTALGFEWVPTMRIGSGCTVHLRAGELPMTGRLVVRVSRHYVAVVDGVVHDTHDPTRDGGRCVYGYWRQVTP